MLATQNKKIISHSVKHIAVIMDGNRRWAKQNHLPGIEGHRKGVEALKQLVASLPDYGVEYLTVYAFSTENWRRDEKEVDFLFRLLGEVAIKELKNLHKKNVRVKIIGDMQALENIPARASLDELEKTTALNTGLKLQVALNYGSLDEIAQALNQIKKNKLGLNHENFEANLYTANIPKPEIMIRTGGEKRMSNFLLWQCAQSNLVFTDTLWPDFNKEELERILVNYGASQTNPVG